MQYGLVALAAVIIIGFMFLVFRFLMPAFSAKATAISMITGVVGVISLPLGFSVAALGWIGKSGAASATADNLLIFGASSLIVGLICCAVSRIYIRP